MYRKFSLINGNNTTLPLTDSEIFANSPSGLGIGVDTSLLRLGNESTKTYEQFQLIDITMELLFYKKSNELRYAQYDNFVSFVTVEPLYLVYEIPTSQGLKSYRRRVFLKQINKTEVSRDGIMHCPVTFGALTFYEDFLPTEVNLTNASTTIVTNSVLDTPIELTITGSTTNPQITALQNNVTFGIFKIVGTYTSIYMNSHDSAEELTLTNGSSDIANPYGKQDFTLYSTYPNCYKTFIKLKNGTNVITRSIGTATAKITYRNRYVSI